VPPDCATPPSGGCPRCSDFDAGAAGEERPVDRCLDDVRSADIYVGVLAWRYGFVPAGGHTSITELEYRAAGEAGIPRRLVQEYRRLDLEALTPPDRDEHLQIELRDVLVEPDVREDARRRVA
jgi:Domain of unknown function (DUF4062)